MKNFYSKGFKIFTGLLTLMMVFVLSSCSKGKTPAGPISKTEVHLGTPCTITIYDNAPKDVFEKLFKRLTEIEDRMTINEGNSEVIAVNSKAGEDFIKVSEDTFYVIKTGKEYSRLSGGRFDITVGPLVKLWNIGPENPNPSVPAPKEINQAKSLIDYNKILLDEGGKRVMLKDKGMKIDLGGIAKGYAADECIRILKESGVKHAIVNLGGNVFTLGKKLDGNDWNIGIQDPFGERDKTIGVLKSSDKTIVTSGVYERYFEEKGKRYHHILDTKTGYPVENELVGISIITDKSINGDSLSTSVFSMGLRDGMKFVETQKDVEAIFMTKDYDVYITSGLKSIFTITNDKFKLKN